MKPRIMQKYKTLVAPSAWAPAIVNLDYSSLSKEDTSALNTFLAREGVAFSDCLTCEDVGFAYSHDASDLTGGAECQRYWFPV